MYGKLRSGRSGVSGFEVTKGKKEQYQRQKSSAKERKKKGDTRCTYIQNDVDTYIYKLAANRYSFEADT